MNKLITWYIRKVKLSPMKHVFYVGNRNFDVYLKANVGYEEIITLEAMDEIGAWRRAEQYIKEDKG